MGDFKSKLPDLKEILGITGKLFKDIKNSVTEIVEDYKSKREEVTPDPVQPTTTGVNPSSVPVEPPTSVPIEPPATPVPEQEPTNTKSKK